MNILVTGANSELAQLTIAILRQRDNTKLYGLVNRSTDNLRNKITYLTLSDLRKLEVEMDIVIHIAAYIPWQDFNADCDKLYESNCKLVSELTNMYERARTILVSSISVYGAQNRISASSCPMPSNAYALSKMCAELIVGQLNSHAIIRLGAFYGENVTSGFVNRIIDQASSGEIILFGSGNRRQYYIDIENVAEVIAKSTEIDSNFSYPLTGLVSYSNKEIADWILEADPSIKLTNKGSDESYSIEVDASKIFEILDFDYIDNLEQYVKAKLRANG